MIFAFKSDAFSSTSFFFNIQGCSTNVATTPTECDFNTFTCYWNNPDVTYSIPWFFNACSPNSNIYNPIDNQLYSNVINIPCTGISPISKYAYDFNSICSLFEIYAIQEYARQLQPTGRIIMLNMPTTCQWYGTGDQGCIDSKCSIWISTIAAIPTNTQYTVMTNTILHELGHTLNLNHASSSSYEYGDCSCIMGCASNAGTCYNAINTRLLNLSTPVADLTEIDLAIPKNYIVPIYTQNTQNHITITLDQMIPGWVLYLSARSSDASPLGADMNLDSRYDKVLSVHAYNPTLNPPFTYIIALIEPNTNITFDNRNNFMLKYPAVGGILEKEIFNFTKSYLNIKLNSLANNIGANILISLL